MWDIRGGGHLLLHKGGIKKFGDDDSKRNLGTFFKRHLVAMAIHQSDRSF